MIICLKVWWVHLLYGVTVTNATHLRDGRACSSRFNVPMSEGAVKSFLLSMRG